MLWPCQTIAECSHGGAELNLGASANGIQVRYGEMGNANGIWAKTIANALAAIRKRRDSLNHASNRPSIGEPLAEKVRRRKGKLVEGFGLV